MSRGKHGASAEVRRKIQEAETSIDGYQHAVQRLTAENKALKAKLDELVKSHWREIKKLKAQRDEGLSPQLIVLERECRLAKEERDRAISVAKDEAAYRGRAINALLAHLLSSGLTINQAYEWMLQAIDGLTAEEIPVVTSAAGYAKSKEAGLRISRARGERR